MPDDELYHSQFWRVVVNLNQARLGSMLIILKRACFDIFELTVKERDDLWALMRLSRQVLEHCFQPDNVNYEFRMNQRRHVHMHVIPRYFERTPEFAELVFPDNERLTSRRLPPEVHRALVGCLHEGFAQIIKQQSDSLH